MSEKGTQPTQKRLHFRVIPALLDLLIGEGDTRLEELRRDTLFVALTRPQMFAGVTYTFFIINALIAVELFLIFRAWWVLVIALVIHGIGVLACLHEPRIFDLWLTRVRHCPRVKNHAIWKCNSYRP